MNDESRNTQEIFGDFVGGLVDLGARGVDGLIMARAMARLMVKKGIIEREEYIATMKEIAEEEMGQAETTTFLLETYKEILKRLD